MFGDILRNVGNFVGGLFGGNKDDEERKRRQQQQSTPQSTVRQPNIGFNPQSAPLTLSNQQDNRPTVQQPVNILQKRDTPQHSGSIFDIAKPISEGGLNPLADAGKWAENNLVKPIAEQGVKAYNTLQAPVTGLVGEGMATADRVFNQGRNADNILQATKKQMDDQLRKSYVTPEVASGRANPLEFGKQFAQTGIELAPYAVGAPEFKAAADGAVGVLPALSRTTNELVGKASSKVPSILAPVARNMTSAALVDAPLFAGLDTASQAMDGKFDPAHALQSALMATLIGGTVPRGLAPTRGGRNLLRGEVERTAEKGITGERPVVQEPPTVKPTSDPNSPISAPTRPVPKEPAITSPNRPATPPPVAEPVAPPRVMAESTTPPQILSRPANSNALPPEPLTPAPIPEPIQAQKQAIQKAIEEQKLQAPPENPLPTPATLEMPKQAQARAIAEQSTPINQEAVQASEKTRAVNDAPTEAMKKEAMKYGTAEEFVRANQSSPEIRAAEAKLAEIKARPDYQDFTKGGKITGKTWNDNNAAGVEYRNAVDARSKQLTDLYNQAHAEAKAPAQGSSSFTSKDAQIMAEMLDNSPNTVTEDSIRQFAESRNYNPNDFLKAVKDHSQFDASGNLKADRTPEALAAKRTQQAIDNRKSNIEALGDFTKEMTSLNKERVAKILSKETRFEGQKTTKREVMERFASDESRVGRQLDKNNYRIVRKDDPSTGITVSKTEYDYYNYIKKQSTPTPQAPKPEAPDPTAALKQEALKYKSADEFLQAKADEGGKLSDTLEPFGKRTPEQADLENLHAAVNLYDNLPDQKAAIKKYTDLYNQAHTEAKVKTSEPAKSPPTEAIAKSVEDELSGRLRSRVMSSFGSKEYRNAIHEAYVKLPEEYKNWIENFSRRSRSITQQDEAILHPERYMDLYKRETSPVSLNLAERLPTSKLAETPSPTPRTLDDVMADVNKLDDTNPTNAKRLQELSDEFDKLAETKEIPPAAPNPTPPSDGELGKVAREAILDGSITTKEGQAEVIRKTTELANREAEQAGTTIDDIIRKGQETWEKSQLAKHDLSPSEVANGAKTPDGKAIKPVEGFTPEQQSIYQRYSQELSTVRNRTEVALKEGDQGAWYSPRQYLDDMGNAPEYNPELINERKRNNSAKTNSEGNPLDYSTRQHEDYLRRYMTAEDAGAKRLVDAVELHSETGEPTGIKLSDKSKTNLEKGMQKVVEKRDEGLKLQAKGDSRGAEKVARQVQKEIDKTINRLIADIPSGPGRKAAIDQIKVLRGTYMQSTVQTLALSNIVNRVFDQGARAVLGAQRPLTGFIEKRIAPLMNKKVMPGTEAFTLNTSKEARQAAKEMSKGTLKGEIVDNYRANTSMAGAGRNPFAKTFAKIDAHLRASGTALTQAGDISTQVARRTFELGASRPEAQGLKTVADYKKYMADYMNSKNFKTDLASVESDLMNRIGLSGSAGDNMAHAGKFSRTISKYLDNGVKTGVEALGQKFGVKGLGDKRIVQEISDYWKVNGPGYAAVTTRVMNYVSNSLALGIPKVIKAVEQAGKGDAAASARATQIAAQSISDAVAVYGTIGASLVLAKIAPDVIGFTGAQPVSGSSDSAYNKSEQIPANQWYINLPGGNRLYIDPSRIGAPGVGANIAGGMQKGTVADTTANTLSQMANQVGGESLIDKYSTVKDAFANPSLSQSQREYAQKRVGSMAAPALGIANNIANLTDDKKRDSAGFTNTLQSRIPGLRQNVPVAKDARGNDIANTKQLSGGSGLVSVGKNTDSKEYQASDPVGTEIARLQKGNKDVFPTNANTNATNKNTQDLAGLLINDKAYKDADDTTKGKMMSSVLNGTDFKNVNTSISNDDKLALMHAKQQGDKKESWLDDNSNAVNYYRADYNNAKANGTLTDKDENLNEKTGKKYLMIGSQVDKDFGADQELKRLYESIGSSDIKNFFNRKSELYDPEMGDRLLAYDEARTNSGVSRNAKYSDKRKYDPTTAKGGGGSNGATVNLPSISKSLTGASDGPKFAEGKRLYNPPKALVAPDNKPYAKPPSISVKRGVHL